MTLNPSDVNDGVQDLIKRGTNIEVDEEAEELDFTCSSPQDAEASPQAQEPPPPQAQGQAQAPLAESAQVRPASRSLRATRAPRAA